jgi:hemolysin activation/secretion protein
MLNKKYLFLSLCTASLIVAEGAYAQSQSDIPSTAEPGITLRGLEGDDRAPSRLEDSIMLKDEALEGDLSQEKVFILKKVVLGKSSVYSQTQIDAMVEEFIGSSVSFYDLNEISLRLTRKYRADGYMFSRVFLPPQEIEEGVVRLEALEGRLTEVEVVGEFEDRKGLIKELAEKIRSEGPTNSEELERYLLLIDDLPGIKARSVLKQSDTPGGGKLIITIEQDTFEGSGSIENRGSRFLGQTRAIAVAAFNSLFGRHDRTTVRGIASKDPKELKFFDVYHEEQVGAEGLRVKGRFAATSTNPGWTLKPLDVEGHSRLLELDALYPYIRTRHYNVNLLGGFSALSSHSKISGIQVSKDKVRSFNAGAEIDFTDDWGGVTQGELLLSKGVDIFNASSDGIGRTRTNGEHDFFRANMSITRLQDLPSKFSVQLAAEGQYSDDPLLASEEFSIGGGVFGRAYDSGEITGDKGLAGAVEIRYGGATDWEYIHSYQLYGFYDYGKAWNENEVVGEQESDSLSSAGVGVRFNLQHDVSGYVEFDKPLTKDVSAEGDEDSRVFFSLLKRF